MTDPYEVAADVASNADDLDLHDLAENVVSAVLALPNVVVLAAGAEAAGARAITELYRDGVPSPLASSQAVIRALQEGSSE